MIKVGDVVRYKSGGCNMTVTHVRQSYCYDTGKEYTELTLVWHDLSYVPCTTTVDALAVQEGLDDE